MCDKLICKICSFEADSNTSISYHVRREHKLTSKKYYDESNKNLQVESVKTIK